MELFEKRVLASILLLIGLTFLALGLSPENLEVLKEAVQAVIEAAKAGLPQ